MRPKEHRESGERDLFRSRLDQIIDMDHALVMLAGSIDWHFLEERLGAVYTDKPGHPPLPTRLMAGLAHPQTHARSVGRSSVRPLGGECELPVLLRRRILPTWARARRRLR